MGIMSVLKFIGASIIEKPLEIIDTQMKFYQERKNTAQVQRLKREEAEFLQKLELDRLRFNAELDDMIARKEIERGTLILDAIKDYQVTMAECATSISESLGKMTIELRRQAHDLMEEKKRAYIQMQNDIRDDAHNQLKKNLQRLSGKQSGADDYGGRRQRATRYRHRKFQELHEND